MQKKSKGATFVLSILPGLGHLYLGQLNRGIQIMIAFFATIFLIDTLNIFTFVIPVLWFFSLFDALQQAERIQLEGKVMDEPFIEWGDIERKKQFLGYGLIVIGSLFVLQKATNYLIFPYYDIVKNVVIGAALVYVGFRLISGRTIFPFKASKDIERKEITVEEQ